MTELVEDGADNTIHVGDNVTLNGRINGSNNSIIIGETDIKSVFRVIINGDRNRVSIGRGSRCRGLDIRIGNHVRAFEVDLSIGPEFSCENECKFLLYNSGNKLLIGDDCMFSNNIIVRCGESPHLIFDRKTGDYLDVSDGVTVGNHVWVGERCYITKRVGIPDGCILAAQSVATRKYTEANSVLGGNPAKVVKKDIQWIRNRGFLEKGSDFEKSYREINSIYINGKH